MNRYLILPLLIAMLLASCSREVPVQEVYPFEVTLLPYHEKATIGEPIEIRCKLTTEQAYVERKYYIRKFQRSGKGTLTLDHGGVVLLDNDNYDLALGDFRLYYTPQEGNQHAIELVVFDNAGQEQQLLLQFTTDNKGGGSGNGSGNGGGNEIPTPDNKNIPAVGDVTLGENGNYYINGSDTGIPVDPAYKPVVTVVDGTYYINGSNTGIAVTPVVTISDGYYYIDGNKTSIPATPNHNPVVTIVDGYYYIDGVNTGVPVSPIVTISDGYYYIDGEKTPVPAPPVRKPLFLVLTMLQAPYGQSLQSMQLLGLASKDFWEGLSDFFTIFE